MSVINQMLKDLEQRQQTNPANNKPVLGARSQTAPQPKNNVLLLITIVILVLLSAFLAYRLWQPEAQHQLSKLVASGAKSSINTELNTAPVQEPMPVQKEPDIVLEAQTDSESGIDTETESAKQALVTTDNEASVIDTRQGQAPVAAAQAEPDQKITSEQSQMTTSEVVARVDKPTESETLNRPALTITSSQVDEASLIAKKQQQANQAINAGQPEKAAIALQDILILSPAAHESRAQLAALWYGKGDMDAALNLLLQGIGLYPEHWPYRLMLAKIYQAQQNQEQAFKVLELAGATPDLEYQVMLAALAQQQKAYAQAVHSYRFLASQFPKQSRWWLGLAIAHDSAGEREPAIEAYLQAQNQSDLSDASRQFIQNRLSQLGG